MNCAIKTTHRAPELTRVLSVLFFLTTATALGQTETEERVRVVTVCDILLDQAEFNGRTIAVLGRFAHSDEGTWLVEDECGQKIRANGVAAGGAALRILVWVEPRGGPLRQASAKPALDQDSLGLKLEQAAKTTKLGKHSQYECRVLSLDDHKLACGWSEEPDRWAIAYGQVETMGDRGYGFGHLAGAPAQVLLKVPVFFVDEKALETNRLPAK